MGPTEKEDQYGLGTAWHRGRAWRRGITTGTCAAAAAKGAALILKGSPVQEKVAVTLPTGRVLSIPLSHQEMVPEGAIASVIKDGGDDPDQTHGLTITARVRLLPANEIKLTAGQGVGLVTKPGLPIPPGEPAINPVPRQMIISNVKEVLGDAGAEIEISVPGGEKTALKTMNPQLGIKGGISILGTTGIVEPMSEEAFKYSLLGRIRQVKALGFSTLVLVPGRTGEKAAIEQFGLPADMIAQMSNFVGYMLEAGVREGFRTILLVGHLGKLVKVAGGNFHTHNRVSDGRLETMAAWLGVLGASPALLRELLSQTTTEGAITLVKGHGFEHLFPLLAREAEKRCELYLRGEEVKVGVVMTDINGGLLGMGPEACRIGGELEWQIPSR